MCHIQCVQFLLASRFFVRNGTEIEQHSMPWLVYLGPGGCTGSIIGKKHILTASHCMGNTKVAVGAHNLDDIEKGIGQYVTVEDEHPYPGRDIMVVTLAKELTFDQNIGKAILAPPSNDDCNLCKGHCSGTLDASGWGIDPITDRKLINNLICVYIFI